MQRALIIEPGEKYQVLHPDDDGAQYNHTSHLIDLGNN